MAGLMGKTPLETQVPLEVPSRPGTRGGGENETLPLKTPQPPEFLSWQRLALPGGEALENRRGLM